MSEQNKIPDAAVEAAYGAWRRHKPIRGKGDAKEAMREAMEAAAPHIAGYALRQAADRLEGRMIEPAAEYGEQQYAAGYADAIARIILMPEAKVGL